MFVFFNCFDKMRFNDSIATASLYHQCNIFKLLQKPVQRYSVYKDIKQWKAANPHIRETGTTEYLTYHLDKLL